MYSRYGSRDKAKCLRPGILGTAPPRDGCDKLDGCDKVECLPADGLLQREPLGVMF